MSIKEQIEYYFSEQNLKQDEFFYNKLKNDGHVSIENVLNCKKIKKLTQKKQDIINCIKDSSIVKLTEDQMNLYIDQIENIQFIGKENKAKDQNKIQQNKFENFVPLIFSFETSENSGIEWKLITESLLKNYKIFSPYVRIKDNQGHFAIDKNSVNQNLTDQIQKEGLFDGKLKITLCEGDSLKQFYEQHGTHLNYIIQMKKDEFNRKLKQQKTKENNQKVEFNGKVFDNLNKIKQLFKFMLNKYNPGEYVNEEDSGYLKALLEFHSNKDKKLSDFEGFEVQYHKEHPQIKCFNVNKKGGQLEDFSVTKCLENLKNSLQNN